MNYDELDPRELDSRTRYQLLTSIVVPRPIGWISTFGADGTPNLAPFSYYAALSHAPMLVGVSVGHRNSGPKDTLVNIRAKQAFCANLVTEPHLQAMNESSGDYPIEVDEFDRTGLGMARGRVIDAPYVMGAPAVLECRVVKEVDLGAAPNTLVIGEVVHLRVDRSLPRAPGTEYLDSETLAPVGRLWGPTYASLGKVTQLPRPEV